MKHPVRIWLLLVVLLTVASGSDCPRRALWQTQPPPPTVFSAQPTLLEVISVVNANRSRAMSIYSNRATISGSGFPSMRASLAVGSPRQLRLRAGTGITGSEIDLGSNDQMFWLWIKRSQPPMMYTGRHDLLASSAVGRTFPIRTEWLVEAIGLVYLDPQTPHSGPIFRPDGRLEIHTPVESPGGRYTKILVLDARSGVVYEQRLLDDRGQVIASALSSRHFRDPVSGLTMPLETMLSWPSLGMNLTLSLADVQVNPLELSPELWTKPAYPGYQEVDVTAGGGVMPMPGTERPMVPVAPVSPLSPPMGASTGIGPPPGTGWQGQ
ncbi:MAG: hypothetical protein K8T25_10465 [Planctomycetia bacterium]|nr:hypothetical protein [Planctomycetia bacterium]